MTSVQTVLTVLLRHYTSLLYADAKCRLKDEVVQHAHVGMIQRVAEGHDWIYFSSLCRKSTVILLVIWTVLTSFHMGLSDTGTMQLSHAFLLLTLVLGIATMWSAFCRKPRKRLGAHADPYLFASDGTYVAQAWTKNMTWDEKMINVTCITGDVKKSWNQCQFNFQLSTPIPLSEECRVSPSHMVNVIPLMNIMLPDNICPKPHRRLQHKTYVVAARKIIIA